MGANEPKAAVTAEDRRFLRDFEACTLPPEGFHHRDHVHLGWVYLQTLTVTAALARFCESLKRFAAAAGKPGLYHETVTWAYLLLIHERLARTGRTVTWEEFAARNPDLLSWRPSILDAYYRPVVLDSDLARRVFVLPGAP